MQRCAVSYTRRAEFYFRRNIFRQSKTTIGKSRNLVYIDPQSTPLFNKIRKFYEFERMESVSLKFARKHMKIKKLFVRHGSLKDKNGN